MNKIAQYLNQHIVGNVFDKLTVRDAYSNDRSIIKNVPRLVAVPENATDIRKILRFVDQLAKRGYKLPVTMRGNGHDKTGAAVGGGIVVSTEKLNKIQEIDVRDRLVRVQTGVTIGELNSALALHGLTVPVAAHPDETIGGLISNCPTDDFANKYGGIYNYVDCAEVILSNGDIIQTGILSRRGLKHKKGQTSFEGEIYRGLDRIIDQNPQEPSKHIDSAGYSSISLVKQKKTFDILPLLFGSQGSLGIVSEVIMRCEIIPPQTKHLLICFNSIRPALEFADFVKTLNPLMLNFYDGRIFQSAIDNGKKTSLTGRKLDKSYILLIAFNDKKRRTKKSIKKCLKKLPASARAVIESNDNTEEFKVVINSLVSYLNDDIRGERAPILDDVTIDNHNFAGFLKDLQELEQRLNMPLPIFGSLANAVYSVRPELQLDQIAGRQFALKFIREYAELIKKHEGSVTGGSPEGCVKAIAMEMSKKDRKLYEDIKNTLDPYNVLNPDIKLGADAKSIIRHLRTYYNYYIVTK